MKKETEKMQYSMYRNKTEMEHELYVDAGSNYNYNWSHWNNNKSFIEKWETVPGKYSADALQKTDIPGTSNVIRSVE
jgi:hypothetical protein